MICNRRITAGFNRESDSVALGGLNTGQLRHDPGRRLADGDLDIVDGPPPVVVPLMIPGDYRLLGSSGVAKRQCHGLVVGGRCVRIEFQQHNRFATIEGNRHGAVLRFLSPT